MLCGMAFEPVTLPQRLPSTTVRKFVLPVYNRQAVYSAQ